MYSLLYIINDACTWSPKDLISIGTGVHIDWKLFTSTFVLIFIAELPDKTAFATLLMATRASPLSIFIGACAAFFIQSLVAVTFGSLLTHFPEKWIHLIAGILFFIYAFLALRRNEDGEGDEAKFLESKKRLDWKVVWSSFVVIFIAEWGDLTQLATASLEARYHNPVTILVSSTLALWTVTGVVSFLGSHLKRAVQPVLLNRIAAAAFALVGIYMIASWF